MSEIQLPPISPAVRERLERYRAEHADEPVGNVATRLLFEDDRVRIWEMRLEPGEGSSLHRHGHDYYLVILEGDRIGGVAPPGENVEPFAMDLPPGGATVSLPAGALEWAVNVGTKPFYEILVELKDTGPASGS